MFRKSAWKRQRRGSWNWGEKMGKDSKLIVKKLPDNEQGLKEFQESMQEDAAEKERELLLQFPTVYIHNWKGGR